jgi:hypothetical protein
MKGDQIGPGSKNSNKHARIKTKRRFFMISSVDPAQVGAALMTQSDTTPLTSMSSTGAAQADPFKLLPQTTTTTPSSVTETLNNLMVMLQNIVASVGALFGGNGALGGNNGVGGTSPGNFDFLRQVDQEPVTVVPPSNKKQGSGVSDAGQVAYDNQPVIVGDDPAKTPTTTPKPPSKKKKKSTSAGTNLPRSNGEFLWKPASDKDGKLAILLPKGLTGKVKGVQVLSPDGTSVLAKGKYSGNGNGDREHFRFNKPGSAFPDGAIVVITMEDGTKQQVTIKETSNRTTR